MSHGLFGEIDTDVVSTKTLGRRDHLTFRGNVALGRHGWLRLTPAYSLGLVHELLKQSGPEEFVLEPFSGTIGGTWGCATSMLNTWRPNGDANIPFQHFDQIVGDIGKGHALLGRYVHKYFEDIKKHITGLRNVLAPGARCYYIVGNSKFYDTMLPVEHIYAALFADAGFVNVNVETIRKRTSKKELYEFVVHAHTPRN